MYNISRCNNVTIWGCAMAFTQEELEWLKKEREEDNKWFEETKPIFEKRNKRREKISRIILYSLPSEITRRTLAKMAYDIMHTKSKILYKIAKFISFKIIEANPEIKLLQILKKPFSVFLVNSLMDKIFISETIKKFFSLENN